jgi:hypothetical protein
MILVELLVLLISDATTHVVATSIDDIGGERITGEMVGKL